MPAPSTCRNCGAALPPDVRWCGLCYEPVREFTARAPLHDRVPAPEPRRRIGLVPAGDERNGGHWSRWERTSTTFGPAGRLAVTAAVGGWIVSAFFTMFVVFWLILVFIGGWILREVWRKGWVPEERILASVAPQTPRTELHPEPPTPPAPSWTPTRTKVAWAGSGALALAAALAFAYGNESVQAVIMMAGSLTLLVGWFAFALKS
jgi:hypothetical protein